MPILNATETQAPLNAFDGKCKAWSIYDQTIRDIGAVRHVF